ncbi:DUF305 domain-containing protein [Cellulomonas sp. ATA003]|uniref:DUF305 domain-containing protein n=1 Tax=Cellulomonas sp. ATA003 TaxID=3073064 RepID=UPI0028733E3B|nr:DUF305 domain-containing protein [Cellulomonas sp. ATA003]WNB86767.1 DUF305 domain-containing protein [Cellulomonas sp. ATA003]
MSRRVAAVVALLTSAALALGVLVGSVLLRPSELSVPADTSAAAGFARDMQAHHGQAVELSRLVRDRTDDEELRTVALDILLTQQNQAGQMTGWLEVWDLPQSGAGEPMAWAGDDHDHGGGSGDPDAPTGYAAMAGWVSSEDLARLRDAEGVEAERIYLELMIPHHRGGVEMAELALDRVDVRYVRDLADAIVRSQDAEIQVLETMLAERGGPTG